jgi:hypothetical protein
VTLARMDIMGRGTSAGITPDFYKEIAKIAAKKF